MAFPTMESFCCVIEDDDNVTLKDTLANFGAHRIPYSAVSITVSVVAVFGGIYQMLPRRFYKSRALLYHQRQRIILTWLAFADVLAALALLVRSVLWLSYDGHKHHVRTLQLICAVTSACVQYFYTVTYLWTLCYAVHVYRTLSVKPLWPMRYYHAFTWCSSFFICIVGLTFLYYPELRCYHSLVHILPNYLCSLVPMLTVMIANPVLYRFSMKEAYDRIYDTGTFKQRDHKVVAALVKKFSRFNVIFYVCWIPNIINSIIIRTSWYDEKAFDAVLFTLWYLMAILNPLQAVLNAVVYRNSFEAIQWSTTCRQFLQHVGNVFSCSLHVPPPRVTDDTTPLLRSTNNVLPKVETLKSINNMLSTSI